MEFKFTIYGTGYFVKVFDENHILTTLLKAFPQEKIVELLNDPVLFKQTFREPFSHFVPDQQFTFYKIDEQSRLEIFKERKRTKILFKQLIEQGSLFPYSFVTHEQINFPKGIVIFEEDLGNFGFVKYNEEYSLDKLLIAFAHCNELSESVVCKISYDNQELTLAKSDTLSRRKVVVLND
ncbi:MAG TPA: hypothetical protein VKZ44_06715 [Taishania sp.]|nr:hypothetical protein [Taishania sp.]